MVCLRHIVVFMVFFAGLNEAYADIFYLKGQLGLSVTTDGTLSGSDVNTKVAAPYPITLGIGFHLGKSHSLALDLNYETMKVTELPPSVTAIGSDTQTQVSAMLNYYYHFPDLLILQPFLGFGAGYTQLTIEKNDFEGDGFTWQAILGTDINYSDFLSFVTELRFFNPVDISLSDSNDIEVGKFNTSQIKLLVGVKLTL